MALTLSIKPHERLIVGGAVITNGKAKSELLIENNVPVLRGKDIMSLHEADSPCRKIYFTIQLMYVDQDNLGKHRGVFEELVHDVLQAAPSRGVALGEITALVSDGQYYQALKLTRDLIAYEQEVINHVRSAHAGIS